MSWVSRGDCSTSHWLSFAEQGLPAKARAELRGGQRGYEEPTGWGRGTVTAKTGGASEWDRKAGTQLLTGFMSLLCELDADPLPCLPCGLQ